MPLLVIPAGCQILRGRSGFWHPARVRLLAAPDRGGRWLCLKVDEANATKIANVD